MSKLIDLTGRRFGRLLVLQREGSHWNDMGLHSTPTWRCRCDCGREVVVHGTNLRRGASRSCGCLQRELAAQNRRSEAGRRRNPPAAARQPPLGKGARTDCHASLRTGSQ